jgi:RimJ/RimL family protein N-acetyltransferase
MMYTILPINSKGAREIVTWRYPEPYHVYNLDDNEQGVQEVLDGGFWAVRKSGDLVGYLCFGVQARVPCGMHKGLYPNSHVDIGLAMRPDLTGQGQGLEFSQKALEFARQVYETSNLRLTVASFNERARKVYERAGFQERARFVNRKPGGDTEFIIMTSQD